MNRITAVRGLLVGAATMLLAGTAQSAVDVKIEVQAHLTALGYNTGGVDGVFGRGSQSALRQFEGDYGLPVDGRIDNAARRRLIAQVQAQQTQELGRSLTGFWGTSRGCRSDSNQMRVEGLTVTHKPVWSNKTFNYVLGRTNNPRQYTILQSSDNSQRGKLLEFEPRTNTLRVPELNMLGISDCTRFGVNDQVVFVPMGSGGNSGQSGSGSNGNSGSTLTGLSTEQLLTEIGRRVRAESAERQQIREQVAAVKESNAKLKVRVNKLAERSNRLLNTNQTLTTRVEQRDERIAALTQTVANLREQLANGNANVNVNANAGNEAQLRQRLRRTRQQLNQTQTSLTQAQQHIQALQEANQQLATRLQQQGQPVQNQGTTFSGNEALNILIPQLLNNLGNN